MNKKQFTIFLFSISFSFFGGNFLMSQTIKSTEKLVLNKKIDSLRTKIDSLNYVIFRKNVKFNGLQQLSVGEFQRLETESENGTYGFNYRIEIYMSEIYKSLYISKIEFYSEGIQRLASTYKVDIEKILNINSEETNGLKFIKWNAKNVFEIEVYEKRFFIKILNNNSVKLTK